MLDCYTPRRVLTVVLLPILASCVTPDLGSVYIAEQHEAVRESARIVIYSTRDIDSAIVFYLKIDGERAGRVFQETFVSRAVEPGKRDITAKEQWSYESFGKDLADAANPLKIFEPVDVSFPESLNPGVETTHSLEIEHGQLVFLRLKKDEGKEFFFPCEETRDTTTMCSGIRYDSVFEVVQENQAREQLTGLRESL